MSSSTNKARQRKWLREASMRRLSQLVKDKTEMIDSAQKLKINVTSAEGLEESGLSKQMNQHLENWVEGVESGRECMFALLDSLHNAKDITPAAKSTNFKPLEMVQSLLNLPAHFLCDTGYLFEKVFSRPPATVVKEAVQIIVKKAEEQNSSSLGLQQINLALKQLRLDAMCSANPIVEPVIVDTALETDKQSTNGIDEDGKDTAADEIPPIEDHVRQQIILRVKIITELLRIHIKTASKRKGSSSHGANRHQKRREFALWDETSEDEHAADGADVDLRSLREFVTTPVQQVHQQAMKSPMDSLEQTNTLLKPYLRRLQSLKMLLSSQLNELRDSKAFLALGLSSDASDEDIKKAYRILAVRLHPDKPGGDTAKFQQLQAMYQEVLKRRKTKRDEEDAVKSMREKRQQEHADLRNRRHHQKQQSSKRAGDDEEETSSKNKKKSLEEEDEELEELLRNIDRDLAQDADDIAGFAKTKADLRKKGGLDEDADKDEKEKEDVEEEDKENVLDGSENEASGSESSSTSSSSKLKETKKKKKSVEKEVKNEDENEPASESEPIDDDHSSSEIKKDPKTTEKPAKNPEVEDVDSETDDFPYKTTTSTQKGQSLSSTNTGSGSNSSKTAHNGSKHAASLLRLSLPDKPQGPFDTDELHAAALVQYTQAMLPHLHTAATKATHATQKLIKWQKQWDKIFRDHTLSLPQVMDQLLQVATQALGGHVSFIDHISANNTGHHSNSNSSNSVSSYQETQRQRLLSAPIRAVAPALEVLCDITQRVAATGMELASDCGADFMQTISLEPTFLKEIEVTMNESLACLRAVVPIATSLDQLMSCLQRAYDTHRLSSTSSSSSSSSMSNSTLLDLLTDMMKTSMKNAVATHCGAIDAMMLAANAATGLSDRLRLLLDKVSQHIWLDAKRQADYERMKQEEEEEYSAEDREAMRKARQQQQQPANNNNSSNNKQKKKKKQPGDEGYDSQAEDEDEDEDEEEEDREEVQRRKEAEENPNNLTGMDLLKEKIRKLQVQLYMQQVSALQTMNAETVTLQDNILSELQSLTFLAAPKATNHSTTAAAAAAGGGGNTSSSSSSSSSSGNSSAAVPVIQGVNQEVVESVVSLVAEMLDASLAQFRVQYQLHRPSLLLLPSSSSSTAKTTDNHNTLSLDDNKDEDDENDAFTMSLRHELDVDWVSSALNKHLLWCLDVVLSDHSFVALKTLLQQAKFLPSSSVAAAVGEVKDKEEAAKDSTNNSSSNSNNEKMMPKVALLPDYRAKTLYLASVLDKHAIKHLLFSELPVKLQEILSE